MKKRLLLWTVVITTLTWVSISSQVFADDTPSLGQIIGTALWNTDIWNDIDDKEYQKKISSNEFQQKQKQKYLKILNKFNQYKKAYQWFNSYLQEHISNSNLLDSAKLAIKFSIAEKKYILSLDNKYYMWYIYIWDEADENSIYWKQINDALANIERIKELIMIDWWIYLSIKANNMMVNTYWRWIWTSLAYWIDKKLTNIWLQLAKKDLFNVQIPTYDKLIKRFEWYKNNPKYKNNTKIMWIINLVLAELKWLKDNAVYTTAYVKNPDSYAKSAYDTWKLQTRQKPSYDDLKNKVINLILKNFAK